jgi:hypothetical protein
MPQKMSGDIFVIMSGASHTPDAPLFIIPL